MHRGSRGPGLLGDDQIVVSLTAFDTRSSNPRTSVDWERTLPASPLSLRGFPLMKFDDPRKTP